MNNYFCFKCEQTFKSKEEPKFEFVNRYGTWQCIKCKCGGNAKLIGFETGYMPEEIFYFDGKSRRITKAQLKDIKSRAVTQDGTILRGREGTKYNLSKGMKSGEVDKIHEN